MMLVLQMYMFIVHLHLLQNTFLLFLAPMSQGEPMTPTPHSPNITATNQSNVGGQENQTQHQTQQQQQPQQQGQPNAQSQNTTQQQTQQNRREINTAMVCMIGQVCIHEIVTRTCEVFGYLRQLQPPLGSQNNGKSNQK